MLRLLHVLYTWLVIGAGVYILVLLFPDLNIDLGRELVFMAALIILADWFAVTFPQVLVSGGFAVVLATFLIYGGTESVYVVGISSLIAGGIVNRGNPLRTTLFNAAQYVLAAYGAFYLYNYLGGAGDNKITAANMLPLLAFVAGYYLINQLLMYYYYLPRRDIYPSVTWIDTLKWDALTYFFTAPVGILMAMMYGKNGIAGVVLLFIPVIAGQYILRLYVNLELVNRDLTALYNVSSRLAVTGLDELMKLILKEFKRVAGYHTGVFYLWREEKGYFDPVIVDSPWAGKLRLMPVYPGEGFVGMVAENRQPVLVADTRRRPELREKPGLPRVMRSLMAVPLVSTGGVVGVIVLGSRRPRSFDRHHLHTLTIMGGQASVAVTNAILSNRLPLFFDPKG
ncbi:putative methionine-R-sulfoxide reductase with GAF domain [Desulfohalotomaculum tongense]|uniref:GAF domain-containing protein n=1 Tax=Desulforadius tongensis TaxID=1216062 RepID=UPI0019567C04|nr:GAF domain-containing protein [Desulforadius tongensis]MBM7853679.1 putative methionine-R-sulfoxide reductase with GAF domain [Desulforadius tongensis]